MNVGSSRSSCSSLLAAFPFQTQLTSQLHALASCITAQLHSLASCITAPGVSLFNGNALHLNHDQDPHSGTFNRPCTP